MNYSLVITSRLRPDALRATLLSYYNTMDVRPREVIIIEDSAATEPAWLKEFPFNQLHITWVSNGWSMGEACSIGRAYSHVQYDYVMYLTPDWEFYETGFVRQSLALLDSGVRMVSLRSTPPSIYSRAEPGLHRRQDQEGRIAMLPGHCYLRDPWDTVCSIVDDEPEAYIVVFPPPLPKILIAVLTCHRLDFGQFESGKNPWKGQPYTTHDSGDNSRVQAVRDTWWQDVPPQVDARFFYGTPHARAPLPDEVFLDVPDDYEGLPQKSLAMFRWALDHNYDYILKSDDDTYVYPGRLIREIQQVHPVDYAGHEHGNVCSGGSGYLLSARAMRLLIASTPTHWAEDVNVAHVMGRHHIPSVMLPHHRRGNGTDQFFPKEFDPTKLMPQDVTLNALSPQMMRALYAYHHRENK